MDKILESISLEELSSSLKGEFVGNNVTITGVASIDTVKKGEITWAQNRKTYKVASKSGAAALIVSKEVFEASKASGEELIIPLIIVDNPKYAFAQALSVFYKRCLPLAGIAKTAILGKNVKVGKNVCIGDYSVIGDNVVIEDGAAIFPHVSIGNNVKVGKDSVLYSQASIYDGVIIGERVIIHSGAVIGADGFGFVEIKGRHEKVLQVGIVELGNDVEIGANVTVDRATAGRTYIGDGSKIDNLVQVGHNCQLGKNCIMVSQSGIAGSCKFSDNVTLAAQAGLAPHINIGPNTLIGGRAGVTRDIPGNTIISGFPARPHKEDLRIKAALGKLPETLKIIRNIEKRLEKIENTVKEISKEDD